MLAVRPRSNRKDSKNVIEDIKSRIEALQQRIETLRGIFDLATTQEKDRRMR